MDSPIEAVLGSSPLLALIETINSSERECSPVGQLAWIVERFMDWTVTIVEESLQSNGPGSDISTTLGPEWLQSPASHRFR